MSELPAADIAARVVAWHNRHPLARRLRAADVHSIGHVALPFHDPSAAPEAEPPAAAGSLRERAMARARETATPAAASAPGGPASPAFRDDFIPPLSPAEVAAFAARHGIERPVAPSDAPVRRVSALPGDGRLMWRWLLTAELRAGGARTRVLLSPVPGAPVLGRRMWSLPRVGALAALGGAAGALVLALSLRPGTGGEAPPVAVLPGAMPPAAVASAAALRPALPAASAPDTVASAPAAPASPASRPIDVEPRLGKIDLPSIGPVVDERRRKAAEAAASAAMAAAPTPAMAASAPVFALTTRLLRTRTESQQIAEALTALLVVPGSPVQRVDVLRTGDDFRVVAWPYPGRSDAERAQAALLARGHRLQVISF